MTEQFNIRLSDRWYIDKLGDLSERTGLRRINVAKQLLMHAIEECYPDEEPNDTDLKEDISDIYLHGNLKRTANHD